MINLYVSASEDKIRIYLNSSEIIFPDQQPIIVNDSVYVPARFILEYLNYSVEYDPVKSVLYSTHNILGGTGWSLVERSSKTSWGSNSDVFLLNDRVMYRLRNFNLYFVWDGDTRSVFMRGDVYRPAVIGKSYEEIQSGALTEVPIKLLGKTIYLGESKSNIHAKLGINYKESSSFYNLNTKLQRSIEYFGENDDFFLEYTGDRLSAIKAGSYEYLEDVRDISFSIGSFSMKMDFNTSLYKPKEGEVWDDQLVPKLIKTVKSNKSSDISIKVGSARVLRYDSKFVVTEEMRNKCTYLEASVDTSNW
jgi:hypothetical protein